MRLPSLCRCKVRSESCMHHGRADIRRWTAIMMYMTGSGIQIYSLMSLFFLLKNTVSGMMAVEKGMRDHAQLEACLWD